jgi:hypothetical protein
MNWNTLYITGNADFWEDVNKKLSQSDLNYLPGYIETRTDNKFHGLYWMDKQASLREIKEAIGGKIIWKYRLTFLNELEQTTNPSQGLPETTAFSPKERAMIKSMRKKDQKKQMTI